MSRVSIAFVDEQPLFLAGVSSLFATSDRFHVVATGGSAGEAIEICHKHRPHLLVMDVNLPGDAFAAISKISGKPSFTRVIALTALSTLDTAVRALEAGARGYLLKVSTAEELTAAADTVLRGGTFINQAFAARVIVAMRTAALRKMSAQSLRLSVREQQIVQLLLRGLTNRAIAESLCISEKTVKHYMTILMQKMNARNRLEVVIAAQKLDGAPADQGFGHSPSYN